MRLNTLKPALQKWLAHAKEASPPSSKPVVPVRKEDSKSSSPKKRIWPSEKVVGGEILWKPVDRTAALVVAKAPWWAQPPQTPPPPPSPLESKPKRKKKRHHMGNHSIATDGQAERMPKHDIPGQNYVSTHGVRVVNVNGQQFFNVDDLRAFLISEAPKLVKEANPTIKAAEDARKIIAELCEGIGAGMEKFRADTKVYLEDIRQTRFAVVTETSQMTTSLKEIRQFFFGSDYKDQIARLNEFVGLCERLQKLKESGFLDTVADTMLRLADR